MGPAYTGMMGKLSALYQGIPAETRLLWMGLSILFCVLLKNVLSYSYSLLFQQVSASISHRLRCGILHQLLSVSQSYLDTHDSGKLLSTLSTDTWRVSSAFTVLAGVAINVCMTLTLSLLLLLGCVGVHLETPGGRVREVLRGYSFVANNWYFLKKGVMHLPLLKAWARFWLICFGKSTLTSVWNLLKGDRSLDWSGRLKGQLLALKDIFLGCCHPGRIKEL